MIIKIIAKRLFYLLKYKSYIPTEYIIIPEKKLIYIPIPKVACTSIKSALFGYNNEKDYSKYMTIHSNLHSYISYKLPKKIDEYFVFAFVRNPFERLISCYLDKVKKSVQHNGRYYFDTRYSKILLKTISGVKLTPSTSFSDFIKLVTRIPDWLADSHFRSQYAFLKHIKLDFLGHFESLEEDWKRLQELFNLPSLPHLNPTTAHDLTKFFSSKQLIEKVYRRYYHDIELYYPFEYKKIIKGYYQ